MGNLITIVRNGELIFESLDSWYVPRIGESIALAKWDTIYTVVDVFSVFGKSKTAETVQITVEIKK